MPALSPVGSGAAVVTGRCYRGGCAPQPRRRRVPPGDHLARRRPARASGRRSPDAQSVRAELAALLATADHNPAPWTGAAGGTDRAVLAALVDIALAACTLTNVRAPIRQLSEAANISHSTNGGPDRRPAVRHPGRRRIRPTPGLPEHPQRDHTGQSHATFQTLSAWSGPQLP